MAISPVLGAGPGRGERTLCPYCGTGCGLEVEVRGNAVAEVRGDPVHPVNGGRICRKPAGLGAAVSAADRATVPLLRRDRESPWEEAGWQPALAHVAGELRRIRKEHGPGAVAFYISGQLLTEDYYVVNKLAKGFLGTNNVDSNSRLCMSSAVAGYNGAFGSDGPPPAYDDIEACDLFLLLGSNAAACHPILWSRIRERAAGGARIVVADPRATPTAQSADLHLPVRPGTDLALLNSMLFVLEREGLLDPAFIEAHTEGFEETIAEARRWHPARAAEVCGVEATAIEQAAEMFGTAGAAMALWSMGANQSTVGTLKNRALINLCLATGNLGRPGCGPLSLTGQPNAMGGREVGGLAHLLPGYRRLADPGHRAEIAAHWGVGADAIGAEPGLSATEVIDGLLDGRVRAVLVAATNPVVSLPDGGRVREALERAELLVVSDCHHPTETSALAHVVLPAAAWAEKEGTMTNSERRVGLVRKLVEPPGEARPDWRIFAGLGRKLGYREAFRWPDAAAVYDEWAACTAGRPCDVSGVSHELLRERGSLQWPYPGDGAGPAPARLYEDLRPPTPSGRSRFAPTPHAEPADASSPELPLMLTTGRIADQWHTMTRTAKSPELRRAAGDPWVGLHPDDAAAAGVEAGRLARVRSRRGEVLLRAELDATLPRGVAFAPFHWGALHAPAGAGAVNALSHASLDPVSKQPELKAIAVAVEPAPDRAAAARRRPRGSGRSGRTGRRRLVVVGTGMSGLAVVEEVLRRDPGGWAVTMLGEEPGPVYNRILLSRLLAGDCSPADLEVRPLAWYRERGIDLRGGSPAASVDTARRVVADTSGAEHRYDALVLATGSRAFVPELPGSDLPGVGVFRTWSDAASLGDVPCDGSRVVVLGGGLLGLEAAAALAGRGASVCVVEAADRLMARQLNEPAARMLAAALEARGVQLRLGETAEEIRLRSVRLGSGERLPADRVVIAAGVRPEVSLAVAAGIRTNRATIVDDCLRTSAPGVWAVGECAEHRGTVYGLWAPLAAAARVAGADIAGDPAAFRPQVVATTLKIAGVDIYSGGSATAAEGQDELELRDTRSGRYRRFVLDGGRLAGAILVGDVGDAPRCTAALQSGEPFDESLLGLGAAAPADPDPGRIVCSCNAVTLGRIEEEIEAGAATVPEIAARTAASTGCGGCTGELRGLLAARSSDRNKAEKPAKPRSPSIAP